MTWRVEFAFNVLHRSPAMAAFVAIPHWRSLLQFVVLVVSQDLHQYVGVSVMCGSHAPVGATHLCIFVMSNVTGPQSAVSPCPLPPSAEAKRVSQHRDPLCQAENGAPHLAR